MIRREQDIVRQIVIIQQLVRFGSIIFIFQEGFQCFLSGQFSSAFLGQFSSWIKMVSKYNERGQEDKREGAPELLHLSVKSKIFLGEQAPQNPPPYLTPRSAWHNIWKMLCCWFLLHKNLKRKSKKFDFFFQYHVYLNCKSWTVLPTNSYLFYPKICAHIVPGCPRIASFKCKI